MGALRWWFIVSYCAAPAAWGQTASPDTIPVDTGPADAGPAEPGATQSLFRVVNPGFPSSKVTAVALDRGPKYDREDLAPYFGEGTLARARAAFGQGAWTTTRKLLEGTDTPPARFLRALAAFRAADHAVAAVEFEALADDYRALRDRCLLHAGWAFEALKRWSAAEHAFERVSRTSRLDGDARLGLARARRSRKDFTGALETLAPLVERPPPPWGRDVGAEALLVEADTWAARGTKQREQAALVALWSRHPLAKEAARAEARLGPTGALPPAALVTRAEALIDAHRNAQGAALLEPLLGTLKLPAALACQAHAAAGRAQRKLRNHARAAALLTPVVQRCREGDLRARALYTLGFSNSIAAPRLAATTYETLARDYPEHPYADDALFYAAEEHERRGEVDEAIARLQELVDRSTTGEFTADALFKLFWLLRETSAEEAVQYLEETEGRFQGAADTHDIERAQYWRARTADAMARTADALALWETIAKAHPTTYYGLLARERVEAADEKRGEALWREVRAATERASPFPMYAGRLGRDPQFASAVELLRLGFGDLVPLEVLAIDRSHLPAEALRLLVHLLAASGEARAAHGLARLFLRRELTGPVTVANRATWEVAYPLAFRELVLTHAKDADELDPDLLQALMREESALDPAALSWAGALGLCQLMPATAAEVAARLRLKQPTTTAALLEPSLNIRLGSRYLSDLLFRAKGVKQYALGAYNAGEGSVGRWRRAAPDVPLDVWVETIPLQETRGYVKRVLRSYNTYKLLYAPNEVPRTVAPATRATAKPGARPSPGSHPKT